MNREYFVFAVLAAFAWWVVSYNNQTTQLELEAASIRVVDGDTIAVGTERYRLIGYDTPETTYAKCPREKALGDQATEQLKELIASASTVRLDVEPERDKYDRKLASLRVDGVDVSEALIRLGLARPYHGGKRFGWCD